MNDQDTQADRGEGAATSTRDRACAPRLAQPHRERPLAGRLVGGDVAQVVGHQDRHRQQAQRRAAPPRGRRHGLDMTNAVPTSPSARRTGTPSPRPGPARRTAAGRRSTGPPRQTRAPRPPGSARAGSRAPAQAGERGDARATAARPPAPRAARPRRSREPRRARAARPCRRRARRRSSRSRSSRRPAARAATTQRGARTASRHDGVAAAAPPTTTGSDARRPACAAARPRHQSARERAHGRFGNLEKSGGRFSTYASRPSCASSLM